MLFGLVLHPTETPKNHYSILPELPYLSIICYQISDFLINGIKGDDKLQKMIQYKSLCSRYGCLCYGHTDPNMMYFLKIPIKMKRKVGDVAFEVACQMLFH